MSFFVIVVIDLLPPGIGTRGISAKAAEISL